MGKKKGDDERTQNLRKDLPVVAHEQTLEQVYESYSIEPEKGMSSAQVHESRAKWGSNRLTPAKQTPMWVLYLLQFTDFFSILLTAGGILCFVAYGLDQSDPSNLYLGVVLCLVVWITATFSFYQQAKSNKIMTGFKNMVPKTSKVIRDGAMTIVDAVELVPGDVVEYQEGDSVPADLRCTFTYNLKVDNSALTGESEAQYRMVELERDGHEEEGEAGAELKKVAAIEATNLMFFSTLVVTGHGRGVVIGTGDNTVMGQIAGLTSESSGVGKPPITREIDRFIFIIAAFAITLGLTFLGVGLGLGVMTVVQALVYAISVIVATVPEGLLATLTVALALTAKRMHSKNVLVKSLTSVETLGCTSVIASDKTGTLTQNRMTVQHCWYDSKNYDVPAPRNAPQFKTELEGPNKDIKGPQGWSRYDPQDTSFKMLHRIATLCNNSQFIVEDKESGGLIDLAAEISKPDFNLLDLGCTGDASESGLIKMTQLVHDVNTYRAMFPKLFEIKFNSTNKWQLSVHDQGPFTAKENPGAAAPPLLVMKGAPEKVIKICTKIMFEGKIVPLTEELLAKFNRSYEELGALGERVLGFAYRELEGYDTKYEFADKPSCNFPTDDLIFAGLFALMDPPREGVLEAVAECKRASIKVFMVTGDHPITAKAIAMQVGIIDKEVEKAGDATVCTGDDIRVIMDLPTEKEQNEAFDKVLSHKQIVFARVTPAHKLLIVENNQRHNEVVAVTGDGVNDAPALKKANVGVSMGISGKDVTKEAAAIILLDDNFASIVSGVEEGRLIFDNLKKSICYTLTSKPPELIPFIIWVAADFPLALSTILILAIDLGTDMIPAISLAYEVKEADIMSKPPRNAETDHLVTMSLLIFTYLHFGVLETCGAMFAFVVAFNDYGYAPGNLLGRGLSWDSKQLICLQTSEGASKQCGFGCDPPENPQAQIEALMLAYPAYAPSILAAGGGDSFNYCEDGCYIPSGSPGAPYDPFLEATAAGFRGFKAGVEAVCARTCAWYRTIRDTAGEGGMDYYLAESQKPDSDLRYVMTAEDKTAFEQACAVDASEFFGFTGRKEADSKSEGPVGGFYWWQFRNNYKPKYKYQAVVLQSAQTAYFTAVVMAKIACVIANKTRKLSIVHQGMMGNRIVIYSIIFEIVIVILIVYAPPLNTVFTTEPLYGAHFFMGLPWALLLLTYDEIRKWHIRTFPGGFADRITFW
eukprot:gene12784-16042_t